MGDRNEGQARVGDETHDVQEPELIVEGEVDSGAPQVGAPEEPAPDWERLAQERLEDLQRTKAEFDNFRKRTMRDQADVNARATRGLVDRLLPILDNFERAIAHGDTSPGLALVHRELIGVLAAEGLEQIESDGKPFDPHLHEAVESHEDREVDEPTVTAVHRSGYVFKDKVLRPAMVGVARPVESPPEGDRDDGGE